jgi:hypothetical protein
MVVLFIFQENFSAPFSPCYTRLSYTESHENAETVSRVKEPMGNYCDIRVRIGHHLPLEPLAESRTLDYMDINPYNPPETSTVGVEIIPLLGGFI